MMVGMRLALRWGLTFGGAMLLFLAVVLWQPLGVAAATDTVTVCSNGVVSQSLDYWVTNAAAGDTIVFQTGLTCTGASAIKPASTLTIATNNLTIDGSGATIVVDGNHAVTVFQVNSGITVTIGALTIANGTAPAGSCGGATCGGGIFNAGTLTVTNSTLSGNTASGAGGGIINNNPGGTVTLTNTIVANSSSGGDLAAVVGSFTGNHNLIDDATSAGGFTDNTNGNIICHPALLGTLSSNGGPTQTIPLLPGSLAIDAGAAVGSGPGTNPVPATDQRGAHRPQGAGVDIGAFEVVTSYTTVVNSTADGVAATLNCAAGNMSTCRLRDAIAVVNGNLASGPITFALPNPSTITLDGTQGALTIAQSMTITGPGATALTISGNHAVTVFHVNSGTTVTIGGLTIANGNATGGLCGGLSCGGGIYNLGTLTVTNSTFSGNAANNGGGLYNDQGTVTVTNSTLSANFAGNGGAIFTAGGTATVTNSTFSANSAGQAGGGIYNVGSAMTVTNSTFSGNSAVNFGGGIADTGAGVTLTNTIVAASTSGDLVGFFTGNHNLIDDTSAISGTGNLTNTPALLGPLGTYGSTNGTQTFALLPGSPAIDAGDDPTCQASGAGNVNSLDQRGIARPQPSGGHCDIGAFEARFTLTVSGGTPQSTVLSQPFTQPLAVTFGGADAPTPPSGAPVTFTANPVSGATATLGTPNPAMTNAAGAASVTATANGTAGSYTVTASTPGAVAVTFNLTNIQVSLVVNNTADGAADATRCASGNVNICRLRDAIAAVSAGNSTITFDATVFPANTPTTLTLTAAGGTIALTHSLTLSGAGHRVTLDGGNSVGLFDITSSGLNIAMDTLTFTHSTGAIVNRGSTLVITGCTFTANQDAGGVGGAIDILGGVGTVTNSTFSGNGAGQGGAIYVHPGTLAVTSSTLARNSAPTGMGGGILANGGSVMLTNTLVAGSGAAGGDLVTTGGGTFGGSNNLIDDAASAGGVTDGTSGNIVGKPALLGTLGDYGGATQTMALLPGSPAIDAGTSGGSVPSTDQRGKNRVGAPDIGAFESQGFTLTLTSGDPQSTVVGTAFASPLVVGVTAKNAGEPVQGGVVSFAVVPVGGAGATLTGSPATIGASGQASVTALANGTKGSYTVTTAATGATGTAIFHLTNTAPLVSIVVTPAAMTLKVGQVQQFTATGTYADASTANITSQVMWSSDATAVATVDATGTAHITATQGSVNGQTTVTVSAPTPVGISVPPAPSGRPSGTTSQPGATPAPAPAPVTPPSGGTTPGPAPAPVPTGR